MVKSMTDSSNQHSATEPGATSMRRLNTQKVLKATWNRGLVTASELIELTSLTRATVLNQAKELVATGWLREAEDTRAAGAYSKGRPALRYELDAAKSVVAGIDAGQHRISLALADLRGKEIERRSLSVEPGACGEERLRITEELLRGTLEKHGVQKLGALVIGVPAPVDSGGFSPKVADGFWAAMNPDWRAQLAEYTHLFSVENDANLAAVAELGLGESDSFAALMVGERFGAGVVIDGHLLRGTHGLAGEMRFLSHVTGVGDALGLGYLAREQARHALAGGAESSLRRIPAELVRAEDVFQAAAQQDPLALEILESLGRRLAKVVAVISGFAGLQKVILSGAMAGILQPVIDIADRELAREPELTCVQLAVSELGAEVALQGAISRGIELVRATAPFETQKR